MATTATLKDILTKRFEKREQTRERERKREREREIIRLNIIKPRTITKRRNFNVLRGMHEKESK
jgi:hypothetical protein